MRSYNSGGVCTYGQAGYLFERRQNALRQRSFGRARGIMDPPLKRRREQDSDSDEETYGRRPVLDGIKRLRVSSPENSAMTDEEAATPRSTWRTKAIVPKAPEAGKKRPLELFPAATEASKLPWKMPRQDEFFAEQPIEMPNDASCRAMVVFDPYKSMALSPCPRVELVEDDKQSETASESEEDTGVRFEELPSDNDEPVDMEVD